MMPLSHEKGNPLCAGLRLEGRKDLFQILLILKGECNPPLSRWTRLDGNPTPKGSLGRLGKRKVHVPIGSVCSPGNPRPTGIADLMNRLLTLANGQLFADGSFAEIEPGRHVGQTQESLGVPHGELA